MAIAKKTTYVAGETGTYGNTQKVSLKLPGATEFSVFCYTNGGENTNREVTSFYESCNNGLASNFTTGMNPEWPLEGLFKKDNLAAKVWIERFGFDIDNVDMQIEDLLTGKLLTAKVMLTDLASSGASNDIVKLTCKAMLADPSTLDYIDIPAEAPAQVI